MQQLTSDASGDLTQEFPTIPGQIYSVLVRALPSAVYDGPDASGTIDVQHVCSISGTDTYTPLSTADGDTFSITTTGSDIVEERTFVAHGTALRVDAESLGDSKNIWVALTPVR